MVMPVVILPYIRIAKRRKQYSTQTLWVYLKNNVCPCYSLLFILIKYFFI